MRHLDLFSGIGGFSLAAEWTWGTEHEIVGFCEIDKYCQRVLHKHWPHVQIFKNIGELDGRQFGTVDLITGGHPCQPFSAAGKRRGKEDDRHLWPHYFRVIQEARPRWIIIENVAGIINMELDSLLSDLESANYSVQPFIIPACAVDARHRRDRVWILAYSCGECTGEQRGTVRAETGDLRGNETGSLFGGCGTVLADTVSDAERTAHGQGSGKRIRGRKDKDIGKRDGVGSDVGDGGKDVPDSQIIRPQGVRTRGEQKPEVHEGQAVFMCDSSDGAVWLPEPDICGMVDGISQRLDGDLNGKRMDSSESEIDVSERRMREVWDKITTRVTPQGQKSDEQLTREFTDALSSLSYQTSLAGREEGTEAVSRFMYRLRVALTEIGAMCHPSDTILSAWKSISNQEKDRAFLASYGRPNWGSGEWLGVPRVSKGVKQRVHRLKALGNAIVPEVAYVLMKFIKEVDSN